MIRGSTKTRGYSTILQEALVACRDKKSFKVPCCLPAEGLVEILLYVFGFVHGFPVDDQAGDLRLSGLLDESLLLLRVVASITEDHLVLEPQVVDGPEHLTAVRALGKKYSSRRPGFAGDPRSDPFPEEPLF